MEKHFVTFVSPGTMFPESTTQEIASWDITQAIQMALQVTERHNAKPYAFHFTTRTRGESDFDSKETAKSPHYFLGGEVRTAAEVLAGTDPKEDILRLNVSNNRIKRVITNTNSWKVTCPFEDDDVLLLPWPPVTGIEGRQ
jgi:hypothetical protein